MQSPLCMHLLSVLTFCNRDCESQYSAQCFEYCNAVRSSSVNVISYIGTYITNTCLRSNIGFHRYNNWHGCEYFLLFVDDPGWPQQQKYSFTLDGPIQSMWGTLARLVNLNIFVFLFTSYAWIRMYTQKREMRWGPLHKRLLQIFFFFQRNCERQMKCLSTTFEEVLIKWSVI